MTFNVHRDLLFHVSIRMRKGDRLRSVHLHSSLVRLVFVICQIACIFNVFEFNFSVHIKYATFLLGVLFSQ